MPVLSGVLTAALADAGLARLRELTGSAGARIEGPPPLRPLVSAALAASRRPVLAVTATDREAEDLADTLTDLIGPDAVACLPSWETLPHERLSPRSDTVGRRLTILRRLAHPEPGRELHVLVAAVRSLIQPIAPGLGELEPLRLRVGELHDFDALLHRLVELAYVRVEMVTIRGEFAVRGGIVDVFPPTAEHPVRVELWGDEVAELREFTVADQRSVGPVELLDAPPCRELLLTGPVRARAAELAVTHQNSPQLAELLGKLAEGIPVEGMESLIPALVGSELQLLTDLMPAGGNVLRLDPERVEARARDLVRTGAEFLEASWLAAGAGAAAPIDLGASAYRTLAEVADHATATHRPWSTLSPLTSTDDDVIRPGLTAAPAYHGDVEQALTDLRVHTMTGGAAVIVVAGAGTAQRAIERLGEADVPARLALDGLPEPPEPGLVTVTRGALLDGFVAGDTGLVVLAEGDVTGTRGGETLRKLPSRRRNAVELVSLRPGDYVVHTQHGIGRFVEMRERTVDGARREYLVISYAASRRGHPPDRLFVPTDSLDAVSRYVGGEVPTLNKLGGADWGRTKSRARTAVKQIAAQLVQLYAARQSAPGYAFGPDTPWQRELEDAFPFTETPDQLAAIDEVKADMERPVPMDRVISGDVGFGKTEIAVRAAFKAVQDGKQVAVLVPTTLLASQHLQTFTDRMRAFPVTVKGLSRFTDPADATRVLDGMADGSVDIVIGTHRLLQAGVRWRDLGLVVVDEEQRFGVEHKEHITSLRTHVDVLTLSATPIPRTLEMSLAGIREMSTITTPPEERHPVLTYVGAQDVKQIAAAIRRELLRDGQVFYVHNRVSSIDRTARQLRELVPEARIVVAHGQMNPDLLERTVDGFWRGESDVLVCTTIVESGLDISNANTLVVERADALGLAQLHQLRGRVGRARERGYAYFLFPPEQPLSETAHDRLATIAQHSELGAGTAVAMKDLEIRGAGNILGAEQSGHIAGVGFDLYIRLVGEAVEAFRKHAGAGESDAEPGPVEVRVDLPVDAHVPHDYVTGERLRLEVYRKIAEATDGADLDGVVAELTDRYGEPPTPVRNLLAVAGFRQSCRRLGVAEVALAGSAVRVSPVALLDSGQLRLRRLYPGASYKPATQLVSVPRPVAGDRIGAVPLRDTALLDWCQRLITDLAEPAPVPVAAGASGP